MSEYQIVTVDNSNVDQYGFFCVRNPKHPGYMTKRDWLRERFKEGLRIKLIVTAGGDHAGFLEFVPGENSWRIIHAEDFLVIHCIWVNSKKFHYKNMAAALLDACIKEAKPAGKAGVAVVTSEGSWLVGRNFFIRHGFKQVDQAEPSFHLLIRETGKGKVPSFPKNWSERLNRFKGLQLIYTNQCPYIGKAIAELPPVAEKHDIRLILRELNDPAEARELMVSPYGMFNLVYNGHLLADHPISATRFQNILRKDIGV